MAWRFGAGKFVFVSSGRAGTVLGPAEGGWAGSGVVDVGAGGAGGTEAGVSTTFGGGGIGAVGGGSMTWTGAGFGIGGGDSSFIDDGGGTGGTGADDWTICMPTRPGGGGGNAGPDCAICVGAEPGVGGGGAGAVDGASAAIAFGGAGIEGSPTSTMTSDDGAGGGIVMSAVFAGTGVGVVGRVNAPVAGEIGRGEMGFSTPLGATGGGGYLGGGASSGASGGTIPGNTQGGRPSCAA
jgi:hypothetical protein